MKVAAAINAIQAALPPIEKGEKHAQGWHYRSTAQVYQALSPLLVQHGLAIVPVKVDIHKVEQTVSQRGGVNNWAYVIVEWLLTTGEDQKTACTAGGAMNSGDQAMAVAITYAHKTLLEKLFMISDGADVPAGQTSAAPRPQQAPAQPQYAPAQTAPAPAPPPQQPPPAPQQASAPPTAKPAGSVMLSKYGSKPTSSGGTRYHALGDDECWYSTFSDEIGANMKQCVEQGMAVAIEYNQTQYGRDITTLMPAWGPPDPDTPPPAQQQHEPPPAAPPAAEPEPQGPPPLQVSSGMITGVTQEPVQLNDGGTGVLYRVQTSNGNYGTFDERTGKVAQDLINQRATFHYRIEPRGNYLEKLEPLS